MTGLASVEFVQTEPGADPIVVTAQVNATPQQGFVAWTDPQAVMCWFGPAPNSLESVAIDLRVGGSWRFVEHQQGEESSGFEGQYLAIEPGRLLRFTWVKFAIDSVGERTCTHPSQVEINFSVTAGGSKIEITHSAIVEDEMRRGFAGGWNRGIAALVAYLSKD